MRRAPALVVALLGCLAADAHAQPEAEARAHFERGTELFDEGNYDAALAEFEASFALRPVPVALFNVAQSLKLLFRYDEAITAYRRYLELGGDLDPARVAEVRTTIERLEAAIGTVTIACAPDGATVNVDGRSAGRTPLPAPLRLAAGRRRIEVARPGTIAFREEVVVQGGAAARVCARLAVVGEQATALRITSPVAGAAVRIDGHDVGMVPIDRPVASGAHTIEVTAPGHQRYRGEILVRPGQARSLDVPLEELRSSVLGQWWFWTATGAVVIGAAVTTFVLTRPEDPVPFPGNVQPDTVSAAW